jgi:hypothetical protein
MPQLIKKFDTKKLEAPYGKGTAILEVRTHLPLMEMMRRPEWKALVDKMAKIDTGDLGAMFDTATDVIVEIAAVGWDIVDGKKAVPITRESMEMVAKFQPDTVMSWLTQFIELMPAMLSQVAAGTKSGNGVVRGAHVRRTGKHAGGTPASRRTV